MLSSCLLEDIKKSRQAKQRIQIVVLLRNFTVSADDLFGPGKIS